MRILALDTTSRAGSVALWEEERIVEEQPGDPARSHAERLPGELLAVLNRHGRRLADVDVFAVASGPGAFTGLRIGIATIQGLALAGGQPVVPICSLEALAWTTLVRISPAAPRDLALVTGIDAQRGELYAAAFDPPVDASSRGHAADSGELPVIEPPAVGTAGDLFGAWTAIANRPVWVVGDGGVAHRTAILSARPDAVVLEAVPLLAGAVAMMAARRARRGGALPPEDLRPLYVRRPDAERDRGRRAAR